MAGAGKRTYLRDVNPHLICPLCRGYLIDATTVVECLHSFCRSCILNYLRKDASCPSCKHLLNTAKPNIKADKALQDIVYKLVPGLYHKEMRKRREFYSKHPEHGFAASLNHLGGADSATPEQRGEDVSGRLIFAPEDAISLSLEHLPAGSDPLALLPNNNNDVESSQILASNQKPKLNGIANRRYLQCPALVTIAHLKKFLGLKYSVDMTRYNIDICHRRAPLPEHWTLMDVAYIFAWKRNAPIRFFYRITQEEQQLEAPPNDRPSTPGLGASQPITNDQANEPVEKESKVDHEDKSSKKSKEKQASVNQPETQSQLQVTLQKTSEPEKAKEYFARRTPPGSQKENAKAADANSANNNKSPLTSPKHDETVKQVKSPIKIMKNSDGRYQVLRGSSISPRGINTSDDSINTTTASPKPSPTPTPAKFSVVSIGDGVNSNSVKITLKQCIPGNTNSRNSNTSSSKKPKVISNVLLRNSTQTDKTNASTIMEQMQDIQKQEKQKRKVTFMPVDIDPPASKQAKKSAEQTEKKQFLQSFRLAAKQQAAAAAQANNQESSKSNQMTIRKEQLSVEAQIKEIIKNRENKESSNQQVTNNQNSTSPKKLEVKASSNIANRIGEAKPSIENSVSQTPVISSSNEQQQQPIDVYAFPSDPPTAIPIGSVKRKCPPPILPIFDVRKKAQQYQVGKRAEMNTGRGGAVKCYRNQSKPMLYAKPPASLARPLQNLPNSIGNMTNVNADSSPASSANSTVSSTSPKNTTSQMISNDTRNLLDGCGLNIPASLSITLTGPRSPSLGNDPQLELRGSKDSSQHSSLDKLNPSITLNDKSVDPRVLKALKSGQMRMAMPMANAKTKGRPQSNDQPQGSAAKRKKEETSPQSHRNIMDLNASKKMDVHPLKIPTPLGKFKVKPPPTWSQANNMKNSGKDDAPTHTANGQVVTLNGGQRFYRAPPGSLTPAAHRISDIPAPSGRTPVYAPSFGNSSNNSRPAPNLSSVFPSLKSLYALSQAPTLESVTLRKNREKPGDKSEDLQTCLQDFRDFFLKVEQFHMDSRFRMSAAAVSSATEDKDGNSSSTNPSGGNKSHIAAQCPPVKPARSSAGSFAVPIAKQSVGGLSIKMVNSNSVGKGSGRLFHAGDSEMSTGSADFNAAGQKGRKNENSKEAPSKRDFEQNENCASSTEEGNSQQGAASPRVTSTASPSPPPNVNEASMNALKKSVSSKIGKHQFSRSEVTSYSNKSPESPDSSSVVTENMGNLVDSTK